MKRLEIYSIVLSPLLGFLAFFLPVLLMEGIEIEGEGISFIALVGHTVENMVPLPSAIFLFAIGFLLSTIGPRISPYVSIVVTCKKQYTKGLTGGINVIYGKLQKGNGSETANARRTEHTGIKS